MTVHTKASAFPHDAKPHHQPETSTMGSPQSGLTKRELFAAMAMQGMLSAHQSPSWEEISGIAEDAVRAADSLLHHLSDDQEVSR